MQKPGKSKLGKVYGYKPPHAGHPMLSRVQSIFAEHLNAVAPVPNSIDLTPTLRPVRDQGHEGSCFAFAAAAHKEANCVQWEAQRCGSLTPLGAYLSVAYLSWRTRLAMGTFPQDSGASIADVMGVLQAWGACPEDFLPYTANPGEAGCAASDVAAVPYRVATPCVVPVDALSFKQVLAAGHTIVIGFQVFESFESTGSDGIVPPIQPGEPLLGGHAVLVTGFDAKGMLIRNSWGEGWARAGYCTMPWGYMDNFFEAWTTAG